MDLWFRQLIVTLSNTNRKFIFGDKDEAKEFNYDINISGNKYLSSLKDECVISINNLSYETIVEIINEKIYTVEIKCGYKSSSLITIFKGEVLYITDTLNSDRTHTAKILCASSLVAKYGQTRLSLSLNGNLNMYTVLSYFNRLTGIRNAKISEELKAMTLNSSESVNETFSHYLNRITTENEYLMINSDESTGATYSIYDARLKRGNIKYLSKQTIDLSGGYPKLTKDGLSFSIIPTMQLECGDLIKIDKDLIDISISNKNEISENRGYFLDKEGIYMLFTYSYTLQNHGQAFSMDLQCKSYSLISNYLNLTK